MRNRAAMIILMLMAIVLWAGLALFVNRQPPVGSNLAIFLVIWGLCVSSSMIPLAYAVNARLARSRGRRGDIHRAIREGMLVGILAIILMALQLIGVLSLTTALVLSLVVVLVEVMLSLRERRY
jgi:hypothetical protein